MWLPDRSSLRCCVGGCLCRQFRLVRIVVRWEGKASSRVWLLGGCPRYIFRFSQSLPIFFPSDVCDPILVAHLCVWTDVFMFYIYVYSSLQFARVESFDCDPCMQYYPSCEQCVAQGCLYCETGLGTAICSSPDIASAKSQVCINEGGTPYSSICGSGTVPPVSSCSPETDTCTSKNDGQCDAGGVNCPAGTDCFDCDPCQAYKDDCDLCTKAGCMYCSTDTGSVCNSPALANATVCADKGGTGYVSTCPAQNVCNISNDNCNTQFDLRCDASPSGTCAAGTDWCVFVIKSVMMS
jgi:hypothetical protein